MIKSFCARFGSGLWHVAIVRERGIATWLALQQPSQKELYVECGNMTLVGVFHLQSLEARGLGTTPAIWSRYRHSGTTRIGSVRHVF
jgi:hypothetical protein